MSDLGELRQRVDAAANQFKRINELQHGRWDRLRDLVQKLERDLQTLRESEAAAKRVISRVTDENFELRSMVSTLLRLAEDGSLTDALSEVEAKVSRLEAIVGDTGETAKTKSVPAATTPPQTRSESPKAAPAAPKTPAKPEPAQTAQSAPPGGSATEKQRETEADYDQLVVRQISKLARALNEAKSGRREGTQQDDEGSARTSQGKAAS